MFRMHESENAAAAKAYFDESLSKGDYYFGEGQEIVGDWGGRGAELLGLSGQVTRDEFHRLCDNLHPISGAKLTPRTKNNRRPGYDFNFSPPKSVSLMALVDHRIVDAFRESYLETMRQLEVEMHTRVRVQGQNHDRVTGNMVWADFLHFTSRPMEDGMPDPQLHCHVYVFNATHDLEEGRWKAGQFGYVKRDMPYYQACCHARLAGKLRDLGYEIRKTDTAWEINRVPPDMIRQFSRRTEEIEKIAQDKGIIYIEDKAALAAKTRRRKQPDLSYTHLVGEWVNRMKSGGRKVLERAMRQAVRDTGQKITDRTTVATAVDYGLGHLLSNQSVVSERRVMAEALMWGIDQSVDVQSVQDAIHHRHDLLVRMDQDQRKVTTRDILSEEMSIVDFARQGRGTCAPLGKKDIEFKPISDKGETFELNVEQKNAIQHVLTSQDRIMVIRGAAGVGKTTLMTQAVENIQANGKRVITVAPSAPASRGVLRDEGFKKADTVERLLIDENMQRQAKGQVIWIDEAGLLSVPDMKRVFDLAERANARVILGGDVRQHKPMGRGDALRLLLSEAGLPSAEVTKTLRQRNLDHRSAVQDMNEGRVLEGFDKLVEHGAVIEHTGDDRHKVLAGHFLGIVDKHGGKASYPTVMLLSPTHAEGGKVTNLVREGLRERGLVDRREHDFERLQNLHWSDAKKSDARNYEKGQIVQFFQNCPGNIKRSERLTIASVNKDGTVVGMNDQFQRKRMPLHRAEHFEVFEKSTQRFSKGDQIRFTVNGWTKDRNHRLDNGTIHTIRGVTPTGDIKLTNGWIVDKKHGHMTLGYAATSRAAQGKGPDYEIVAQGRESFGATTEEQWYVTASRAKQGMVVVTDDVQGLRSLVAQRSETRQSAMELMKHPKAPQPVQHQRRSRAMFMNRVAMYAKRGRTFVKQKSQALVDKYGIAASRKGRDLQSTRGVQMELDRGR